MIYAAPANTVPTLENREVTTSWYGKDIIIGLRPVASAMI